jgi:hypothetical protein
LETERLAQHPTPNLRLEPVLGLPRRKEKFRGEVAEAELGATDIRANNFFKRLQLPAGEEGRLGDHWKDWSGDQVPILIEVDWIDGLNVEDVLRVVGVANIEIGIVLKWEADQIGDGILRRSRKSSPCWAWATDVPPRSIKGATRSATKP